MVLELLNLDALECLHLNGECEPSWVRKTRCTIKRQVRYGPYVLPAVGTSIVSTGQHSVGVLLNWRHKCRIRAEATEVLHSSFRYMKSFVLPPRERVQETKWKTSLYTTHLVGGSSSPWGNILIYMHLYMYICIHVSVYPAVGTSVVSTGQHSVGVLLNWRHKCRIRAQATEVLHSSFRYEQILCLATAWKSAGNKMENFTLQHASCRRQ